MTDLGNLEDRHRFDANHLGALKEAGNSAAGVSPNIPVRSRRCLIPVCFAFGRPQPVAVYKFTVKYGLYLVQ
jgi:hypothetical protein